MTVEHRLDVNKDNHFADVLAVACLVNNILFFLARVKEQHLKNVVY
jgi:hypothetical protein